jgi:hypothetical protein
MQQHCTLLRCASYSQCRHVVLLLFCIRCRSKSYRGSAVTLAAASCISVTQYLISFVLQLILLLLLPLYAITNTVLSRMVQ